MQSKRKTNMIDTNTATLLAFSGIFTSIGAAITEIWLKPWLKKIKKKHEEGNEKLRNILKKR
jgi:hypothetical protein